MRLIWSCSRRRAWMKRLEALCSRFRSLAVLPLVSMARIRLRGSSDWRSKTAIFCERPSSAIWKSSLVSPPTKAPVLSVTLTKRLTSFTSMRKVVVLSWAGRTRGTNRKNRAHTQPTIPSGAKGDVERSRGESQENPPSAVKAARGFPAVTARQKPRSFKTLRILPEWLGLESGGMRRLRPTDSNVVGERLSGGPHHAVDEGFLLPDGDGLLECVDQPAAGIERLGAMGRGHHDEHAGFSHVEPSQAVNQAHVTDAEARHR